MADTNARAALMRLRDKVYAEWQKPPAPSPNSPADVWYRHFCRMIDREIAALPADEAAGACDLVAEERAKLVRRVGSDCCNGTDPACGGGCLFERAVRNLDMEAERARADEAVDEARRGYQFRLPEQIDDRCYTCRHAVVHESGSATCQRLDIEVACSRKSRCELWCSKFTGPADEAFTSESGCPTCAGRFPQFCSACGGSGTIYRKEADEAAGASAGLVEAAGALVMWLDRGFPWERRSPLNGELLDLCRNVNNAIAAAERARKPQQPAVATPCMWCGDQTGHVVLGGPSGFCPHQPIGPRFDPPRNIEREAHKFAIAHLQGEVAQRDKTIAELRTLITAAATQIRVAHEKHGEDAPMAAQAHYEEALGMLATHAGEWSPECAKLRDFTTTGELARENAELRDELGKAIASKADEAAGASIALDAANVVASGRALEHSPATGEFRDAAGYLRMDGPVVPSPFWTEERVRQFNESGATPPQPDERDKEIAELREKVADLQDEVAHWMNAQPINCPPEHAELREKLHGLETSRQGWIADCQDAEQRAEKAEAALAEARKAGLRELREIVANGDRVDRVRKHVIDQDGEQEFIRVSHVQEAIDHLIAADSEHKQPEPCEPGHILSSQEVEGIRRAAIARHHSPEPAGDDDVLREFVQWFESPGRHDIQPPVRAAYVLAKRALGVTGGGRKEGGDVR